MHSTARTCTTATTVEPSVQTMSTTRVAHGTRSCSRGGREEVGGEVSVQPCTQRQQKGWVLQRTTRTCSAAKRRSPARDPAAQHKGTSETVMRRATQRPLVRVWQGKPPVPATPPPSAPSAEPTCHVCSANHARLKHEVHEREGEGVGNRALTQSTTDRLGMCRAHHVPALPPTSSPPQEPAPATRAAPATRS